MEASLSGHYNVVDILLKHGATTDLQDNVSLSIHVVNSLSAIRPAEVHLYQRVGRLSM